MKNNRIIGLAILIIIAAALAVISILAFNYAGASTAISNPSASSGTNGYYPNGMMGNWMSGMMGGNWSNPYSTVQTPAATQSSILPFVGFVALIGAALTGIGGAVYYLAVPKNRIMEPVATSPVGVVSSLPQNTVTAYESVSKTLTLEERQVLDVLHAHDGKYLQKYIRLETGLSRLKVHRIVARLAERGIITLEPLGNTNEVRLSSWLKPVNDKKWIDQNAMGINPKVLANGNETSQTVKNEEYIEIAK